MELTGLYKSINLLTPEEQTILLGPFGVKYFHFRDKYNNSKKTKPYLEKVTYLLKNTIYKRLQNKK